MYHILFFRVVNKYVSCSGPSECSSTLTITGRHIVVPDFVDLAIVDYTANARNNDSNNSCRMSVMCAAVKRNDEYIGNRQRSTKTSMPPVSRQKTCEV